AGLRSEESATLERLIHERFIDPEIGRLLEDLREYEESLDSDSDEASLIRVTRRDWEKERKVPSELRGEMARAARTALPAWGAARGSPRTASRRSPEPARRPATPSTSGTSPLRSTARRSAAARRSRVTSHSRGCGRPSSGGASPSCAGSTRGCRLPSRHSSGR